ncbi:MAG: hypothetical protein P8017_05380, partial [Deltaproteobacteria bacterium]
ALSHCCHGFITMEAAPGYHTLWSGEVLEHWSIVNLYPSQELLYPITPVLHYSNTPVFRS